jgi:hypothetical protein
MRRRRPRLQVTTFPFLAVLLCTLGVLIMLLLILDQRSRALARQKAEHDAAEARRAVEDRRHAEAERFATEVRRRVQALQARSAEAQGEAQAIRERAANAAARLEAMQSEIARVENWLREDDVRVANAAQANHATRQEAQRLAQQRRSAEDELIRLRGQVAFLEEAVKRLQEASQLRQPLYSLVPYRGKQGTRRQPIYVECVRERIVFQPDGRVLTLRDLASADTLQAEVKQRTVDVASDAQRKPYVLFLIRPSGISLYYAVVRLLRKSDIDIGYEFIEEDWVFDFTSANTTAAAAPMPLSPPTPGTSGGPKPVQLGSSQPPERPEPTGLPATGARIGPPLAGARSGEPSPIPGGGRLSTSGSASPTEPRNGRPGIPETGAVASAGAAPTTGSGGGGGSGGASNSPPVSPSGPSGPISPVTSPSGPSGGAGEITGAGPATRPPASGKPTLLPPDPTQPPGGAGSGTPAQGGTVAARSEAPPVEQRPERSEEPGPRRPRPVRSGMASLGGGDSQPRNNRPTPLGAAANEWIILIECSATRVTLDASEPLTLDPAQWDRDGPELLRTLQALLARKLAKFPDTRAQLKFQIHPDGLRTYYQVARTLEPLGLRATWEYLPAAVKPR